MYFKLALGNVRKSIRDYGIYFLTLVFGVCVFYAFNSITQQRAVLDMSESQYQMIELLSYIISGVSVFIAVILGFLIVYASRYLIRRRKKEFGTYLLFGMSPGKVSRIIVYETLSVGLISLVVGLVAGVLLSQVLLYVTAALFAITMDMFVFAFSWEALVQTVVYFGVIFVIALLFNAVTVSRYKLIDLINADRKNEGFKLRSIPLSVVLFLTSLVLIGIAYALLLENGLREFDEIFFVSTILVCIGTLLFFYSLAGFLLRAVQANRKLYLRGLNMFTLRQLNAKINTAFASIALVCMALFLAITASCGGFAMCTAFTQNLEASTLYDATLRAFYGELEPSAEEGIPWIAEARADDFDMEAVLRRDISSWDELVGSSTQVDMFDSGVSLQYIYDHSDAAVNNSLLTENAEDNTLTLTSLSDLNGQRRLIGLEPLTLQDDEYLIWCDFDAMKDVYRSVLDRQEELVVLGSALRPANQELQTTLTETTSLAMNGGTIVVSDALIDRDQLPYYSVLNVMYSGEREEMEPLFLAALEETYPALADNTVHSMDWPFTMVVTALEMYEQSVGISVVIAYLAIYIGFVLLITCAAILALQQLSESADNVTRYSLLKKLGIDSTMMNKALLAQTGIYFIFPLVLALCHTFVALTVVADVVSIYGHLDITGPLMLTLGLFALVYGGYFLLTYSASRTMINSSRRQAS